MAKKRGRKPECSEERIARICDAIKSGETNERAAKLGGISETTFYEWLNSKPKFSEAVKAAKLAFEDWERNGLLAEAKKSLKALIMGQEYEEIKTEYDSDPKNPSQPRIKKQTRTTKKVLPNATAVIFALCNRDPENWKNRIANELSGKVETEQTGPGVSLSNVPDELLAQVIESLRK